MNAVEQLAIEQNNQNSAHRWEEPIGFDEYNLPSFRTDVFPKWLKDFIEGVAEETQTPIDASGFAAISLLSTVLARKYEVNIFGNWIETLNTYTVMALGSANRKSSVFKSFVQPILEYEKEQNELLTPIVAKQQDLIRVKQKRIEKLEKDYAKNNDNSIIQEIYSIREEIENEEKINIPSLITADATPEKIADLMAKNYERIALLSAEGAEAFQMMAGRYSKDNRASNIDIYLKGHSADNVSIDRMGRESIKLYNPTLTIGLFVQPSIIKDIPNTFQDRGLTQRFLYSFPKSKVGYRKIEPKQLDQSVRDTFVFYINKLLKIKVNTPRRLTFDEEAGKYEVYLRTQIEDMLRDEDLPDSFQGWIGKLAGQIIRIAGLLHVAEHIGGEIPLTISTDTLYKANELKEYFIQHAKKAHGIMGANENDEDIKYLLKKIIELNKLELGQRELLRKARKFKTNEKYKAALLILEERGYIKLGTDGRKSILYVNPMVLNKKV